MKVSIGMRLKQQPWGGGNQFGNALVSFLRNKGVQVCFDLEPDDIDIILLCEPRKALQISAFSDREIFNYLRRVNSKAIVVHRINECDERKGTKGVNKKLIHANLCADHTVFVASWLEKLFTQRGLPCKRFSVILNGSDRHIFNPEGYKRWNGREPLKFVTHHWGGHWLKGFDIYRRLDDIIGLQPLSHTISFTYIGNLPRGFEFSNAHYIAPKSGHQLADLIRQHHVYLTASINEPGGNHQNEGANCGLPLLYRNSGCMPEYCQGFGLEFTTDNFEAKLQEMITSYSTWTDRVLEYPHTVEKTCSAYYSTFIDLIAQQESIVKARHPWRSLIWFLQEAVYYPKSTLKALVRST